MGKKVRRLFEQFQPEKYHLELDIDRENMKFSGSVAITGKKTGRPSQRLALHQKGLKIQSAAAVKLQKGAAEEIPLSRVNIHKGYDEVRLHSPAMLFPGAYQITLHFSGTITEAMHGMYPCFFEHNGQKKSLIATQFESHHAREVFPCIDEPEAKATFDLTLLTPPDEIVLSNTPVKKQVKQSKKQRTSFETTPVMSPYLLAFVFGDMHAAEARTSDGIMVRSWATAAQPKSFLEHANSEAVKILEFFTDYFHTPFPLKKLDQVALPDFESGAMENWGIITYREVALLADPDNRSISSEQYISMVVGHEISHQWFGNLVTMKWWDDLWLNESFASLMEHIVLDRLHPDWHQWEQYAASDIIAASNRDIYKDVQSVRVDVSHPDEIGTLFDPAIVYAKGGRLLKMLREYIGDEAFRGGLKTYFQKYAYGNTTRDDLWQELAVASGKDVHALMNPWLEQSGMPQLDVEAGKDGLRLSQKRFILDTEKDERIWPVPLFPSQPLEPDILTEKTRLASSPAEPTIFNISGSTHMVVRYLDEPTKEYIEQSVVKQSIPPQTRINILNDYILLARKGELSIIEALEIIERCAGEPRDAVWQLIGRVLGTVSSLTEGNDEKTDQAIKQLKRSLGAGHYRRLGWNDTPQDDPNTKGLRQTILSLMVNGEDKATLAEAQKRYDAAKKVDDLPAEQRGLIIGSVVRSGEDVIDSLIKQYKKTANSDLQHAISGGLCATKDAKMAKYIIDQAIGEDGFVRPQDIFRWYAYLMRNHYTRDEAWKWLTSSWDRLEKLYGDSKSFDYFIIYSAAPLNTPDWQKKFEAFFTPKMEIVALRRNISIGLAEIPARVTWRSREEPKIKAYLKKTA